MAEIKNTFGVINSDTDPQFVENGDYQYALNIRNAGSTGEQVGSIEPVRGNEKKQYSLPFGVNTCIGQYSHDEENDIYFFIQNNQGNHQIVRYFYELETFQQILQTPELKFQSGAHIVEANIIEGQLFFNDTVNEVRRLDLQECIAFNDAQTWGFNATVPGLGGINQVVLQGDTPPPYEVGDEITVVRNWRGAWLDTTDELSPVYSFTQIFDANITVDGEVTGVFVNGINQIEVPVPYTVGPGSGAALVSALIEAINNYTPEEGLDFTADDFGGLQIIAPIGVPNSLLGEVPVISDTGGLNVSPGIFAPLGSLPFSPTQKGYFHNYDPNPTYSDQQEVIAINGNDLTISAVDTGIQDFLEDANGNQSYIGGLAYPYQQGRKFTLPFRENSIKLYRPNPPHSVYGEYGSDRSRKVNNLRGRLFQFKTRYVYPNGMRSVPSPINKLTLPRFEQNIPFEDLPVWEDNYIDLWFDTGGHDVVAIELMVRESSNPADQDWSITPILNKDRESIKSNTSYNYRFYGDELRVKIPVAEGEQPMDYIPFKGSAFCFIRDKRDAIGGCDEGFDHFDVDVDCRPVALFDNSTLFVGRMTATDPEDSQTTLEETTENNLPAQIAMPWPNDKLGSPEDVVIGWLSNPFFQASPMEPTQGGLTIPYSFSFGFTGTVPFPNGWEQILNPGTQNFGNGFVTINFVVQTPQGENTTDIVPGAIVIMNIKFQLLKFLAWYQDTDGISPETAIAMGPPPITFEDYIAQGALAYRESVNSDQSLYRDFNVTFKRVLSNSDTPNSVKNYFVDQIENSPEIQGYEYPITLSTFSELESGQASYWRTKKTEAKLYMDIVDLPTATFRIRPRVEVDSFNLADNGDSAFAGTVSLNRLREIYKIMGVRSFTPKLRIFNNIGLRGYKTGANHLFAIEYRDSVGRRHTLSPVDIQYVPYFNETYGLGTVGVGMFLRINNPAPLGATHYQLMYAGNTTMQDWLTFEVAWIDSSGAEGVKIALTQRVSNYNKQNNDAGVSDVSDISGRCNVAYSWTRGDRLRFLTQWTGDQSIPDSGDPDQDIPFVEFVDMEVIAEGTDTTSPPPSFAPFGLVIIVDKDDIIPYLQNEQFGRGSLIEVYTPKENTSEDQVLYREIGEPFQITNQSHHGNRLNQGPNTPGADSPFAEILLCDHGDAFAIGRVKISDSTRSKERFLESSSFSDFYPSYGWGPGTANRVNYDARRQLKKELIRYSGFLIGDRNGLNRYFDGNVNDEADVIHGTIRRMECPDTDLYVFQELSTGLMPIRAQELMTATGQSQIMRSDNVIGNIRYIPGSFGIGAHRESLAYWGGVFYFASIANGLFLRLAGTNFEAISKKKKDNYWNTVFEMISRSRQKVRILSEFDPKYGELIVHVPAFFIGNPTLGDRPDFLGATWGYSEQKQGWSTEYSYFPEIIGRHRNKLVSWKRGQLYIHDKTENWNQFYDNEPAQDSKIRLIFNERPNAIKFLQAIGLMYNQGPVEPKETVISSPYGIGQRTSLFAGNEDWEYTESQYVAVIRQNELTPGVEFPIINGDDMRGQYFLVELSFDPEFKFELFAVSLEHKPSEMTIKPS